MSTLHTVISTILKGFVKRLFGVLGLEVRRKQVDEKCLTPRLSLVGALQHASSLGLSPTTVLDVGAAYGRFTLKCNDIFPASSYLLIEPLQEYKRYLEEVIETMPKAECILAAASARSGEITINVHPDLVGSSMYLEHEDSNVNGVPRVVPAETLDNICKRRSAYGPYLIKMDVQGAELDVLLGAKEVLNETEYLILEVSLFEFFEGGPQLYDIVNHMKSLGFVVYDVFGLAYRPLDNAMSQIDIALVRDKSRFRKYHFYATQEQRGEQTEKLRQSTE